MVSCGRRLKHIGVALASALHLGFDRIVTPQRTGLPISATMLDILKYYLHIMSRYRWRPRSGCKLNEAGSCRRSCRLLNVVPECMKRLSSDGHGSGGGIIIVTTVPRSSNLMSVSTKTKAESNFFLFQERILFRSFESTFSLSPKSHSIKLVSLGAAVECQEIVI